MEKLIITAAVNGGITSRGKNPNVPYTPEEIAESICQCWKVGASITHIHPRDLENRSSNGFCIMKEIVAKVREYSGTNFERTVA